VPGIDSVIENNLCVGCGACAFAYPDQFEITESERGTLEAVRRSGASSANTAASVICPMSGEGKTEDDFSELLYPALPADPEIGRYAGTFAGHVNSESQRMAGGSGGIVTWILAQLLREQMVDAVIHVRPSDHRSGRLFTYQISRSVSEIEAGSKSRYYPTSMDRVLNSIEKSGERFAIVGVPCFVKAIRMLVSEGRLKSSSVPYAVGLVCGHLKSKFFAEYLAWQKGIAPGSLTAFDFRHKLMDRAASDYGFLTVTGEGAAASSSAFPMASVRGRDWGEGLFKLKGCEFCDDVIAECADIAIGDAWLPEFVSDPKGTNVVVARHPDLLRLLEQGRASQELSLTSISVGDVAKSQSSGLRHRREGLRHRLARLKDAGEWWPRKRVEPALAVTSRRRSVYDIRYKIACESNNVFAKARLTSSLIFFERTMSPLIRKLKVKTYGGIFTRAVRRIRHIISA